MGSSRMPDSSLGRVSLMGDPDISLKIVQLIIPDNFLSIPDYFEYKEITSMGENKCPLLTCGIIVFAVYFSSVLINKFIFGLPACKCLQIIF
jgi:hypothetical protein